MSPKKDEPKDTVPDVKAKPKFYVCEHASSNSPCPVHNGDLFDHKPAGNGEFKLVPKPGAVKDEDWHVDYGDADSKAITDRLGVTAFDGADDDG